MKHAQKVGEKAQEDSVKMPGTVVFLFLVFYYRWFSRKDDTAAASAVNFQDRVKRDSAAAHTFYTTFTGRNAASRPTDRKLQNLLSLRTNSENKDRRRDLRKDTDSFHGLTSWHPRSTLGIPPLSQSSSRWVMLESVWTSWRKEKYVRIDL